MRERTHHSIVRRAKQWRRVCRRGTAHVILTAGVGRACYDSNAWRPCYFFFVFLPEAFAVVLKRFASSFEMNLPVLASRLIVAGLLPALLAISSSPCKLSPTRQHCSAQRTPISI
jgi:hypothetical protein